MSNIQLCLICASIYMANDKFVMGLIWCAIAAIDLIIQ